MSNTKASKNNHKKQVVFLDFKSESSPTINTNYGISGNSMVAQKYVSVPSSKNIQSKRSSISQRRLLIKVKQPVTKTNTIHSVNKTTENKIQSGSEKLNKQNETITSELRTTANQMELQTNVNDKISIENQETFNLLDKIRQSVTAVAIGPMPLSLQACRFELPFDLKLLETLTPLDYLSKYCRLSSRRQYQFKRIFDKYRNRNSHFESSYLFLSLLDIHQQNLTHEKFDYLCQLIDLDNLQYQFTFDIYAGILALCERILYKSSILHKNQDDYNLTKDEIEKCNFYSLDRKFDGLVISDTMKQLLNAL